MNVPNPGVFRWLLRGLLVLLLLATALQLWYLGWIVWWK